MCLGTSLTSESDFFYAFRRVEYDKLQCIKKFYELIQEWDKSIRTSQNESVSQTKFSWWKTEIERFVRHQSQHPLTKQLQNCKLSSVIRAEYLEEILDSFLMILPRNTTTVDTSLLFHQKLGGYVFTIISELLGINGHSELLEANTQGILCQRIHFIRYYGYWINNILPVSLESCQKFGISTNVLYNPHSEESLWMSFIRQEIDDILKKQDLLERQRKRRKLNSEFSPLNIVSKISRLFLKKIDKNPMVILSNPVTVTPIRALLSALLK
ncbi:squalene/phytoene synthase family protein [Candidatus Ichthyocystis hellenicum]|uniref:squalene/phytoene synthase family protein n=1 Tax=Candidatus Ichthyocystis hellenicum TaxID=1561003 RepID=UPI001585104D|nr:squalene/phytoene synthase family protein [Candidatus Ichthyocystis hellenicum]